MSFFNVLLDLTPKKQFKDDKNIALQNSVADFEEFLRKDLSNENIKINEFNYQKHLQSLNIEDIETRNSFYVLNKKNQKSENYKLIQDMKQVTIDQEAHIYKDNKISKELEESKKLSKKEFNQIQNLSSQSSTEQQISNFNTQFSQNDYFKNSENIKKIVSKEKVKEVIVIEKKDKKDSSTNSKSIVDKEINVFLGRGNKTKDLSGNYKVEVEEKIFRKKEAVDINDSLKSQNLENKRDFRKDIKRVNLEKDEVKREASKVLKNGEESILQRDNKLAIGENWINKIEKIDKKDSITNIKRVNDKEVGAVFDGDNKTKDLSGNYKGVEDKVFSSKDEIWLKNKRRDDLEKNDAIKMKSGASRVVKDNEEYVLQRVERVIFEGKGINKIEKIDKKDGIINIKRVNDKEVGAVFDGDNKTKDLSGNYKAAEEKILKNKETIDFNDTLKSQNLENRNFIKYIKRDNFEKNLESYSKNFKDDEFLVNSEKKSFDYDVFDTLSNKKDSLKNIKNEYKVDKIDIKTAKNRKDTAFIRDVSEKNTKKDRADILENIETNIDNEVLTINSYDQMLQKKDRFKESSLYKNRDLDSYNNIQNTNANNTSSSNDFSNSGGDSESFENYSRNETLEMKNSSYNQKNSFTFKMNDVIVNAALKNNHLTLTLNSGGYILFTNGLEGEIRTILKESGFRNFNIQIRDKEKKVYITSYQNTSIERKARSKIDVMA
ncbi:hypothetical protein [Nitrosophilus labii]|uniref:hypothetical protein n=1 Tax=Nitrosophilus labii TaxID=2706014 RepID=UPI0016570969|nr:hypothetical protein [Nitrosophilus labii]